MSEKEIISQVYEIGFHFIPGVGDEGSGEAFTKLRTVLEDNKAEVISFELPSRIGLAYPIEKMMDHKKQIYTESYFGWIKFDVARESMDVIKGAVEKNDEILRYIIIKTVRENTLAPKKVYQAKQDRDRKSNSVTTEEEPQEMDKEEVDRQIDALVDEEEVTS